MGTSLTVRVAADDRTSAVEASDAALEEVARLEALISSWDSTTPLGRLNRAPVDRPVPVAPELLALLARADALADSTDRAFEPAVGPLVDAWDLRGGGRRPSAAEVERALEAVRAGFRFDPDAGTAVRLHGDAWIDAGGFGKGAALEAAAEVLEDAGVRSALLDFGGQALTVGERPDGAAWRIGVAHPARRDEPARTLRLGGGLSAATSGGSERPGHLLDPRTGRQLPAWGSVTVVSPDPVAADALATALFVLGPDDALRWARSRDGVGVLVLEELPDAGGSAGLRAGWNPAMGRWLDPDTAGDSTLAPSAAPDTARGGDRTNLESLEGSDDT